jgi:splicing factor 3A subunit 1
MEKVAQGELEDDTPKDTKGTEEVEPKEPVDLGLEPPLPEFIMNLPNISAIDLYVYLLCLITVLTKSLIYFSDIMKLTALFTARRGRMFLASLSSREGRNYQFDFLRPTHSLFGYFNRLVEQYTKIIQPNKETLVQLKSQTQPDARWETLAIARRHAKWEKNKREKDKKREDDQEAERCACAFLVFLGHQADCKIQWLLLKLTGMIMQLCKRLNLPPSMPIPSYRHP